MTDAEKVQAILDLLNDPNRDRPCIAVSTLHSIVGYGR